MKKPSLSIVVAVDYTGSWQQFLMPYIASGQHKDDFQLIIVDNNFKNEIEEQQNTLDGVAYTLLRTNAGRAAKRNLGLARANADIILHYADDFIPTPGSLEAHLDFHQRHPEQEAVAIGTAVFRKEDCSPYMEWMEDTGSLFGIRMCTYEEETPLDYYFGANTSLKKSFQEQVGLFDEAFLYDACDDYDMYLRMKALAMKSYILPQAKAIHEHLVGFDERITLLKFAGTSTPIIDQKMPDMIFPWENQKTADTALILKDAQEAYTAFEKDKKLSDLFAYYTLIGDYHFTVAYQDALAKHV